MDREKLLQHLEQLYSSKRDILSRIPLGIQPDALWQELQNRRRSRCTQLPLTNQRGIPYWYVTTAKMAAASEKIVETLFDNEKDFDPYSETLTVTTLEEVFYTSYVEGSQISMQEAMDYLTSEKPPKDMEEQLITNNRMAGSYAGSNLYRTIDADFLQELTFLLTDGLEHGGNQFRSDDFSDHVSVYSNYYSLPPAHTIPVKVNEVTSFLAAPNFHPLIKAAVVQAWTILVRPFPEGNERLGRMLSNIILLRAGYSFFSEISLSALIARKSYGYYQAIENILREEHDGDLTYFLDYFMELLSRGIDEWILRKRKREEENRQTELNLAHVPLTQSESFSSFTEPISDETHSSVITEWPQNDSDEIISTCPVEVISSNDSVSPIEYLLQNAEYPERIIGQLSIFILNRIEDGNIHFRIAEVAEVFHLKPSQLSSSIRSMRDRGILIFEGKYDNNTYYRIEAGEIPEPERIKRNLKNAEEQGIDPEILYLIRNLLSSSMSQKDRRVGTMLALFLPKGQISYNDYNEYGHETRWKTDMDLALQLGLVERNSRTHCTILRQLKEGPPNLSKTQKKVMNEMYDQFGDSIFSTDMVIAIFGYTDSHVSTYLHRFTLLKILACSKEEEMYKYQFLVNPEEYPQLFEIAA